MRRLANQSAPLLLLLMLVGAYTCVACTGIMLTGADGTVVAARTNEWGAFDWNSTLVYVPRGTSISCQSPCNSCPGMRYVTRYRVVGINGRDYPVVGDGMNECGLVVGAFYLPGFTEWTPYDSSRRDCTMSSIDVCLYLLSQCATVDEVCELVTRRPPAFFVAAITLKELGFPMPFHYRVADATGKSIVIEYVNGGEVRIYDALLGVITNAPTYDWHLMNVRNYVELQPINRNGIEIDSDEFLPFGSGSGLLGLPGDTTPPSRFIQAVAYTWTARSTLGGLDTVNEAFRVLDHFNIATYGAEGHLRLQQDDPLPSATQWTSAADTKNLIYYYHTAWNRRVRMLDLKTIDSGISVVTYMPLDPLHRQQDVQTMSFTVSGD